MTRGTEDCALISHAIHGADGRDKTAIDAPFAWTTTEMQPLRVGYDVVAFDSVKDEAHTAIYAGVLDKLRAQGIEPVPIALPDTAKLAPEIIELIIFAESAAAFADLTRSGKLAELAQQGKDNWPNIFRVGSTIPASDYLRALQLRTQLQVEMATLFTTIDAYVTVPLEGPSLAATNLTGHPTVVTRAGMANNLPVSVEFTGKLYGEAQILQLAKRVEEKIVWPNIS